MTVLIDFMSRPRAATSVATSRCCWPDLKESSTFMRVNCRSGVLCGGGGRGRGDLGIAIAWHSVREHSMKVSVETGSRSQGALQQEATKRLAAGKAHCHCERLVNAS